MGGVKLSDELRTVADTVERNGGWHIAAVKIRAAADQLDAHPSEPQAEIEVACKLLRSAFPYVPNSNQDLRYRIQTFLCGYPEDGT